MELNLKGSNSHCFPTMLVMMTFQMTHPSGRCLASNIKLKLDRHKSGINLLSVPELFWIEQDNTGEFSENGILLSRERREANNTSESKSIWKKIEEFYADKNNMATFCVLPVLVLIYGGCSSIYCIHKCRLYFKRRKHKRLKEEDSQSLDTNKENLDNATKDQGLHQEIDRPVSQISSAWTDLQVDTNGNRWSGQTDKNSLVSFNASPLPWQVPSRDETPRATSQCTQQMSLAGYIEDILRNDDINNKDKNRLSQFQDKHWTDGQNQGNYADSRINCHNKMHGPVKLPLTMQTFNSHSFGKTRTDVNLSDYATNSSSALKAADYSRFSNSKSFEIIPLTAEPKLRVWDPLTSSTAVGRGASSDHMELPKLEEVPQLTDSGKNTLEIKKEMMTRYDALSTLQMTKKAAEILNTNAIEGMQPLGRPTRKNQIFISE